jgi:hypothetical protein
MTMKSAKAYLFGLSLIVLMTAAPFASAQAEHVRWDIISVNFTPPFTISAGGIASAVANDGSHITLTGSGTFVAPAGGNGSTSAVTGGGTWKIFAASAVIPSAMGTYSVTGLVRWNPAPFPPGGPPPRTDLIDPTATRSTGLAILRISYSDGEDGILVVSCTGVTAPANMFEGVTATKGFIDYKVPVAPVGGVDANRTLFHIE